VSATSLEILDLRHVFSPANGLTIGKILHWGMCYGTGLGGFIAPA
jgi:hypothetical protein